MKREEEGKDGEKSGEGRENKRQEEKKEKGSKLLPNGQCGILDKFYRLPDL